MAAVVCKTEGDVGRRLKVWHVTGGRSDVKVDEQPFHDDWEFSNEQNALMRW